MTSGREGGCWQLLHTCLLAPVAKFTPATPLFALECCPTPGPERKENMVSVLTSASISPFRS